MMSLPLNINQLMKLFQFDLFKTIGGTNGSSSGCIVLAAIFEYLIEPQLLRNVSWTGKSDSKLKKKTKFENYTEVRFV